MNASAPIIEAKGLRKSFGRTEVLHGLDFTIPAGRIYGVIGHNGAGKTTTLNAVLGLTDYEGDLRVLGQSPFESRAQLMNDVAFISDVASLPRFLKVKELFELLGDIHPNFKEERANVFLQGTDLQPDLKIKNLSKGMVAQLHLAAVMAIDAKLLVLDEPTLGLDIVYRKRFYRRLLEDYMSDDRTIVITTHQVDEIEHLLTDIMFIRDGSIVLDAPIEEISERYQQVVLNDENVESAKALKPIFSEASFGRTAMMFDQVDKEILEALGDVSTPTVSDLFVALMQRDTANPGER